MTEEQIIKGNELIAEFIKAKWNIEYYDGQKGLFIMDFSFEKIIRELNFHQCWNLLISVVEKIESIYDDFHGYFGVHIYSNSCTIQGTKLNTSIENPHYAYFNSNTLDTKIESTWYTIVQWIEWYNENLKK